MSAFNLTGSNASPADYVSRKPSMHAGLTGLTGFTWATRTRMNISQNCYVLDEMNKSLVRVTQTMLTLLTMLRASKYKGLVITGLLGVSVMDCKGVCYGR